MTATLMPLLRAKFFDSSNNPLSGGKVYTYAAGTSTPKASYTDYNAGTLNANPVILNSLGEADIWLNGNYKINVTDSNDVQLSGYPVDNITSIQNLSNYYVTTGSSNAYVLTVNPSLTSYTAGTLYRIKPNFTNTGAATINISGLGAKSLVKNTSAALVANDLISGQIYEIIYDGTNFQVTNIGNNFTSLVVGSINDVNNNEVLIIGSTASAVNEVTITNAATGSGPSIKSSGTDTNVPLVLAGKGNVGVQPISAIDMAVPVTIASASTCDISASISNNIIISGTTTITSFGTTNKNCIRYIKFSGALTLTHNATSLILPTAANITTVAGDTCIAVSDNTGNWTVINYQRANGLLYPIARFSHTLAAGTSGGATTATTWSTCPINTTDYNTIAGASLASNQVTLPAGTYLMSGLCTFFDDGPATLGTKCKIRNVTDSTDAAFFQSGYMNAASVISANYTIGMTEYIVTITGTKTFEMQYYVNVAQTVNGLGAGYGASGTVEIYREWIIKKIA